MSFVEEMLVPPEVFFNLEGHLDPAYRQGVSAFQLMSESDLANMEKFINQAKEQGCLKEFMQEYDQDKLKNGEVSVFCHQTIRR